MRMLGAATGLLVAVTCALAIAAMAAAAGAPTSSSSPPCTARQLAATVESSSGAGGTIVLRVALRNRGAACSLAGYPTLRLRKGAAILPTRTVHGGLALLEASANPVELAGPARAFLLLAYTDRLGGCPETSGVDLWLNGWQRPVVVSAMIAACDGGRIRTSPFLRAARVAPTA